MFSEAKTIAEAIEMATVDANDEYEQASGWLVCLGQIFKDIDFIEINGVAMKFIGFDLEREIVPMVICELNKKRARVAINSVQFVKPNKAQKLWLRAWAKWSN